MTKGCSKFGEMWYADANRWVCTNRNRANRGHGNSLCVHFERK